MASLVHKYVLVLVFACLCKVFAANATTEPVVAFSTGLSNTQYFTSGDTVLYDNVFLNEHSGYNPSTGVFTCPVAGIYSLQFHAYSTNHNEVLWLDLHHNDKITVSVSGYNSHTVGSNSILMKLRQGDRLQVRSRDQQSFSLFGIKDQIYSTFSGFLLSESANRVFHDNPIVG